MDERSRGNLELDYIGKDLESMANACNYRAWIIEELRPYLRGTIAEVGAGVGHFSEDLLKGGAAELHAYEPSRRMYEQLVQKLAGEPKAAAIHEAFHAKGSRTQYDVIVYINVLEHIEADSVELDQAYSALKPDGHIVVFVPALPWLYSSFDKRIGHFRRYLLPELHVKVIEAGFNLVMSRYFDITGVLPWYLNFVVLKRDLDGASVSIYDRYVVPLVKRLERWFKPRIGKNILLVARKPS